VPGPPAPDRTVQPRWASPESVEPLWSKSSNSTPVASVLDGGDVRTAGPAPIAIGWSTAGLPSTHTPNTRGLWTHHETFSAIADAYLVVGVRPQWGRIDVVDKVFARAGQQYAHAVADTLYAACGDLSLAYRVHGDGPVDLVFVAPLLSHVELNLTLPELKASFDQLASFSRVLVIDKAGVGLSDPIPHIRTLDDRTAEIEAVMDAAGF
jgi:hypothetical protein